MSEAVLQPRPPPPASPLLSKGRGTLTFMLSAQGSHLEQEETEQPRNTTWWSWGMHDGCVELNTGPGEDTLVDEACPQLTLPLTRNATGT